MRVLILIQLLAGFVLAFSGVIVMFHLHVWSGLLVTLCGMYGVLRAVHHSSYENGIERGRELYDEQYEIDLENEEETRRLVEEGKIESFTKEELDKDPGKLFRRK